MPRPIGYFETRKREAPDWVIPGLLKRCNTAFIIGQPKKACKSWLLLNLAWDLSEGRPLWGVTHTKEGPVFPIERPMRVVYFSQEDTEDDIQDRTEILMKGGRVSNNNFWVVPKDMGYLLNTKEGLTKIQSELDTVVAEAGPIDLIIFDPMRRMHSEKENDSDGMIQIWQAIDAIYRRYKCSVIMSHHTKKPVFGIKGSDRPDNTSPYMARGSGDIYGAGDAFMMVNPSKTGKGGRPTGYATEDIHFETKRSGTPTPIKLSVNFTDGSVVFDQFLSL